MKSSEKPVKAKPVFYAHCYFNLKTIAEEYGYNLVLHGSMDRDLDLIAIPWVDNPKDDFEMVQAFSKYLKVLVPANKESAMFGMMPGGRKSYIINLNRGGAWNGHVDNQYYIDISVTPFKK